MAHKSRFIFENFEEITGYPSYFVKTGYLVLVPSDDVKAFRENIALHRKIGVAVEEISLKEVQEIFSHVCVKDLAAAAYERDSGYAEPVNVALGFAKRAKELGVKLMLGTSLIGIEVEGDKICAAITDKGKISTPCVVNAAGPWAWEVGKMVGLELPLKLLRHQVFIFRPPFTPKTGGTDLNIYFRPEGEDQMLIGEGNDREVKDPNTYPKGTDLEALEEGGRKGIRRFREFEKAEFIKGWSGLFTVTPDWHPILDESPLRGFYLAVGFSGHGFKLAPMVGLCMAELIINGRSKINISSLTLNRFEKGNLLRSRYRMNVLA
jgi:sarcosine oxidase subunit beta